MLHRPDLFRRGQQELGSLAQAALCVQSLLSPDADGRAPHLCIGCQRAIRRDWALFWQGEIELPDGHRVSFVTPEGQVPVVGLCSGCLDIVKVRASKARPRSMRFETCTMCGVRIFAVHRAVQESRRAIFRYGCHPGAASDESWIVEWAASVCLSCRLRLVRVPVLRACAQDSRGLLFNLTDLVDAFPYVGQVVRMFRPHGACTLDLIAPGRSMDLKVAMRLDLTQGRLVLDLHSPPVIFPVSYYPWDPEPQEGQP